MSSLDGHAGAGSTAPRALAIDLDEPCWALRSRDPLGQASHWLNLESDGLLFLAEADALDEATEDPRDDEPTRVRDFGPERYCVLRTTGGSLVRSSPLTSQ